MTPEGSKNLDLALPELLTPCSQLGNYRNYTSST